MTHNTNYSYNWKLANWKEFQKVLFRLQKRIFKAVRDRDKANTRKFQNVVLSSHADKLLVIRQETQLNQSEKTAGTDDKKALTLKKNDSN
jgi:RNA-directed DNA polymerase